MFLPFLGIYSANTFISSPTHQRPRCTYLCYSLDDNLVVSVNLRFSASIRQQGLSQGDPRRSPLLRTRAGSARNTLRPHARKEDVRARNAALADKSDRRAARISAVPVARRSSRRSAPSRLSRVTSRAIWLKRPRSTTCSTTTASLDSCCFSTRNTMSPCDRRPVLRRAPCRSGRKHPCCCNIPDGDSPGSRPPSPSCPPPSRAGTWVSRRRAGELSCQEQKRPATLIYSPAPPTWRQGGQWRAMLGCDCPQNAGTAHWWSGGEDKRDRAPRDANWLEKTDAGRWLDEGETKGGRKDSCIDLGPEKV